MYMLTICYLLLRLLFFLDMKKCMNDSSDFSVLFLFLRSISWKELKILLQSATIFLWSSEKNSSCTIEMNLKKNAG